MDGVHDMGGMHGFGPIPLEENEPVFHEAWEGRVHALGGAVKHALNPQGTGRHLLELLPPAEYLASSYYERWLRRAELQLLKLGDITQQELDERIAFYHEHPEAPAPRHADADILQRAHGMFRPQKPLHQPDGTAPRFAVGDVVRTKNIHPAGHTRLPRYARGKVGVIARVHGSHDFPDTRAQGLGSQPQGISSVRFEARELWGESTEGRGGVFIDLWDSYLEPADQQDQIDGGTP